MFENQSAMPRAWLTAEIAVLPREDILHTIETTRLPTGNVFDPHRMALVEELLPHADATRKADAKEDSLSLDLDRGRIVRVRTSSAEPRMLILSDAFDAGWKARVDGQDAPVQRCDFLFMGIPLAPGRHVVELTYRPRLLFLGAGVSMLALLVTVALLLVPARYPPNSMNPDVTNDE